MSNNDRIEIKDLAALIETSLAAIREHLHALGLEGLSETLRHSQVSAYKIHHLTLPTINKDTPPFIDVA
jgi:hypothetical protein